MTFVTTLVASSLLALAASTQPSSKPTTSSRPTTSAGRPATPLTSGDPKVDRVLERLEARGNKVHALACNLVANFLDVVAEDEQSKVGRLWFRRDKPNPKFKVIYDKSVYDGVETDDKHEYYFDGHWLVEAHHKSKTGNERELVAKGEKVDPFRIGKGPFPLPFGQKKDEILEHFTVSRIRRSPKDAPKTDHLKLIPRQNSDMARQYAEIHFYVAKSDLPTRIVAHQRRPGSNEVDEIVTVDFKEIKIDPKIPTSVMTVTKQSGDGWHWTRTPLADNPPPPDRR